jgi:hypothetical protein
MPEATNKAMGTYFVSPLDSSTKEVDQIKIQRQKELECCIRAVLVALLLARDYTVAQVANFKYAPPGKLRILAFRILAENSAKDIKWEDFADASYIQEGGPSSHAQAHSSMVSRQVDISSSPHPFTFSLHRLPPHIH